MSAGFRGFGADALAFFKALAFHQTKEWMEGNKKLYETEVKAPMAALLADASARFAEVGVPLKGDAKSSTFRLNRDVRFSKDKSLYKTHCGAVMTRSGNKNDQGLIYIHIDPNGCFLASGFYHPEPPQLAQIRQDIIAREAAFREVQAHLSPRGLELSDDEALTRNPRGFEAVADPLLSAALRQRSLVVRRPLEEKLIFSPELVEAVVRMGQDALPLLSFGWNAVDRVPAATADEPGVKRARR